MESLGLLVKNDRARKLAESKLKDEEATVRAAAATALGQIGLKTATAALTSALHDTEAGVVFACASSLLQLGDATAYRVYYAVLTGERKTGEPLVESQLKMLKDPEALARIGFEQGIGFIPFGGIGLTVFKSFKRTTSRRCALPRRSDWQKIRILRAAARWRLRRPTRSGSCARRL